MAHARSSIYNHRSRDRSTMAHVLCVGGLEGREILHSLLHSLRARERIIALARDTYCCVGFPAIANALFGGSLASI